MSDDAAPGTGQDAELAGVFEQHRRHLRAIAYRMLGSLPEADDVVQETWVRFAAAGTEGVGNVSGWLTTIVTRACLNALRTRAARPEQLAGMHVPDPIAVRADDAAPDPEQEALLAESVGLALMVVLDALAPAERVAFVLHDVFGVPFSVIGQIVGRSDQAARQLASRARRQVKEAGPSTPDVGLPQQRAIVNAFFAAAKSPLTQSELLYRDVARQVGLPWQLLAACDWMQCEARPRYSPVHGEKLGAVNADGTAYRTKSAALEQCAYDLIDLAGSVYAIDLTTRRLLSVTDLASTFAAFRWGALLRQHHTSPMEFPYSVAGLTVQHLTMRWPRIDEPHTPDRPGGRFRRPFGAVPVVLSLHYPATA